jgi:hypothetical protein
MMPLPPLLPPRRSLPPPLPLLHLPLPLLSHLPRPSLRCRHRRPTLTLPARLPARLLFPRTSLLLLLSLTTLPLLLTMTVRRSVRCNTCTRTRLFYIFGLLCSIYRRVRTFRGQDVGGRRVEGNKNRYDLYQQYWNNSTLRHTNRRDWDVRDVNFSFRFLMFAFHFSTSSQFQFCVIQPSS